MSRNGCSCFVLIVLLLNLVIGGWTFDYCLRIILGKDIPWYGDALCGLILGEVTVPVAIVLYILDCFGALTIPLVGG